LAGGSGGQVAIGFALSAVSEIDFEEDSIYFQLRNVRYKIVFDDNPKSKLLIEQISKIIERRSQASAPKIKKLPEFYKKDD